MRQGLEPEADRENVPFVDLICASLQYLAFGRHFISPEELQFMTTGTQGVNHRFTAQLGNFSEQDVPKGMGPGRIVRADRPGDSDKACECDGPGTR